MGFLVGFGGGGFWLFFCSFTWFFGGLVVVLVVFMSFCSVFKGFGGDFGSIFDFGGSAAGLALAAFVVVGCNAVADSF